MTGATTRILIKNMKVFEKVISVETMRHSDAYTIENYIDSKSLMYKAGVGVFESCDWFGRVAIVCGSGNNAGDGYVLALLLKEINIPVTLFLIKDKFSQDGRYYFDRCINAKIPYHLCDENTSFMDYNIIVDCIFGTGFKGTARGIAGEIIDKINNSQGTVISVDINSGLNGDNGISEKCVKSNTTVSIGYLKPGLLINDAPKYIGNLKNCHIGIELVGEYYVLQDNLPDISVKEIIFENLKDFSAHFNIPYETAFEKPVEVISSVAKEKNISVLVKNLGEYSVIVSENKAYIIRG